jgi:hypothetical protein
MKCNATKTHNPEKKTHTNIKLTAFFLSLERKFQIPICLLSKTDLPPLQSLKSKSFRANVSPLDGGAMSFSTPYHRLPSLFPALSLSCSSFRAGH